MRFAYADPPYPGRAHYYPERTEVDHQALVERLVAEFPDGWALSTSAEALQHVLALCPGGVRVCAWQRAVRPARSRRPISAWEPLVVHGGPLLPAVMTSRRPVTQHPPGGRCWLSMSSSSRRRRSGWRLYVGRRGCCATSSGACGRAIPWSRSGAGGSAAE